MSPGVLLYNNVLESLMFQRYDSGVQLPAPGPSPPLRHVPEQCTYSVWPRAPLSELCTCLGSWLAACALRIVLCELQGVRILKIFSDWRVVD